MPYSTYIVLDFNLFVFHDKARRTQQGNLLRDITPLTCYFDVGKKTGVFWSKIVTFSSLLALVDLCLVILGPNENTILGPFSG